MRRSLISVEPLTLEEISEIFRRTGVFKREGIPRRGKGHWVLLFLEPSTRTRLSFERALRSLGFETYLFTAEGSSMKKGETLRDTVLTLHAQSFDGIVIRTGENGALETLKDIDLHIVNAGDGTNEHPTQALVDTFTLRETFGDLKGLRVLYVGDIAFSRVFRSGYRLLKKLGAEVGYCAPRALRPAENPFGIREFDDIDDALRWCDAAIFLRIQKERQSRPLITSEGDFLRTFGLTPERAEYLRGEGKYYLHPGPVNRNVEIASSEVYGKNSLILEQVKNGIFVRAAVIDFLTG